MRLNRLKSIFLLIIGFTALGLTFSYREEIRNFVLFTAEKVKIYYDNFFIAVNQGTLRHMPLSTLKKETELSLYIGPPFRDFEPEQWREFWQLIYGVYPKEPAEKAGLPNRMRQLSAEEISAELTQLYPNPFSYFQKEHWNSFFDILFSK